MKYRFTRPSPLRKEKKNDERKQRNATIHETKPRPKNIFNIMCTHACVRAYLCVCVFKKMYMKLCFLTWDIAVISFNPPLTMFLFPFSLFPSFLLLHESCSERLFLICAFLFMFIPPWSRVGGYLLCCMFVCRSSRCIYLDRVCFF